MGAQWFSHSCKSHDSLSEEWKRKWKPPYHWVQGLGSGGLCMLVNSGEDLRDYMADRGYD